MNIITLKDKKIIEAHFRRNTDLNIYSIGDLDDFFWKHTKWYATGPEDNPEQIALLYEGAEQPTLLAIAERNIESMILLIEKIKDELPERMYCHLSKGIVRAFGEKYIKEDHGIHYKMSLKKRSLLLNTMDENIRRLLPDDIEIINILYEESYPDNFFDKRMLETGKYFGYFNNSKNKGKLAGIAGIHVYSEKYKVATLGNITIDPSHRGKSVCQKLTSVLCNDLLLSVDNIGLNVSKQNLPAVNCYTKIGFEIIAEYQEYLITKNK